MPASRCSSVLVDSGDHLDDRIAVSNLKRLTEAYTARQVYDSVPVTPEEATDLRAKLEERSVFETKELLRLASPLLAPVCGLVRVSTSACLSGQSRGCDMPAHAAGT